MADAKSGFQRTHAWIGRQQDKAFGALVSFYGRIGGPEAAAHEQATIDAMKAGHLAESWSTSLKINGDIVTHVARHHTPAVAKSLAPDPKPGGRAR